MHQDSAKWAAKYAGEVDSVGQVQDGIAGLRVQVTPSCARQSRASVAHFDGRKHVDVIESLNSKCPALLAVEPSSR
jgi:hypothetical protein